MGGFNVEELAAKLGVDRKTLRRYETGETTPTDGFVLGWAVRCGVDPDWLLYGDDNPQDSDDPDTLVRSRCFRQYEVAA